MKGMGDSLEETDELETTKKFKFITPSAEAIVKEVQEEDWEDEREHFSSRMYYLLAMMQLCLTFHGIFGCPLASLNHGGIVFFIPYTIFIIILGYPIHFMECSLGQYSQLGPVKVWKCVPLATGIGLACICLCLVVAFYNNLYAIYAVMYLARCSDNVLPWSDCDTPSFKNRSCVPRMSTDVGHYTPAEHYFYDHILQLDMQLDLAEHVGHYHFGRFIWQQALAFCYSWFIVYLSLFQNITSLERILPIFVGVPIFCLVLFFSLGIQLHGAFYGWRIFVATSNFQHLLSLSTWCKAAELVLIELGIAQGTLIAYGSYAHHRNRTHLDSSRIICARYVISVGSTIIIWFLVGSLSSEMAKSYSLHFDDFGYVFILFTEVLGKLPGARIWCICIFILIFLSCANSQISIMQTIACALYDQFPQLLELRCLLNLGLCSLFACSGILLCTTTSWVLLQLFYEIPNILSRIPIASFTVAAIVLIYGINKYCEDLHFLINYYPSFLLRLSFYIAPFLMLGLYVVNWHLYSPFVDLEFIVLKMVLYLILIWKPIWLLYWVILSAINGNLQDCWRSLESWGPSPEKAKVARAYFSSESRVTLSMPWSKKTSD